MDGNDGKALGIRPGRAAEKGQSTDVGRDYGYTDRPPRRCPASKVEIFGRADTLAQYPTEQQVQKHIADQDRPIECSEI